MVRTSRFWKNEMTFNFAQNHVAKTKVQESDSSRNKSAATTRVKLCSVPCVSLCYAAEVAAVAINTFRSGLSLLITVGSEEILTGFPNAFQSDKGDNPGNLIAN